MAMPILPRPMMPSVLPRSSRPVKRLRAHSPRRSEASAAGMWRASANSRASVCSAAAIVLPVGALTTTMPAAVAASQVDVVDAHAGAARRRPGACRRRSPRRLPGPGCGRAARRSRGGCAGRRRRVEARCGRRPRARREGAPAPASREGLGDEDPSRGAEAADRSPGRGCASAASLRGHAAARSPRRPGATPARPGPPR